MFGHQPLVVDLCVSECIIHYVCPRTCCHIARRMMNR